MKALCALVSAAVLACPACVRAQQVRSWNFVVRLDGTVVGSHRFVVEDSVRGERVTSSARFDVPVLGVTVYRYRHVSHELWQGDCIADIDAHTDDGFKQTEVRGHLTPAGFLLDGAQAPVNGCLMTFAYWNAHLPRQTRLLDPGTGRIVPVHIERRDGGRRWRISGLPNPIEIEWDDREWIGLDTVVSGRRLTYRLQ